MNKWKLWLEREKLDNYSKPGISRAKPPENETDQERSNRQCVTYEIIKENEGKGYVSELLQKKPEMRAKYENYARQG
jgi:hypothetical protein